MENKRISDVVNVRDLRTGVLNLVTGSCGAGKTYWSTEILPKSIPGLKPWDMLYVTSRSLAAGQVINKEGFSKFNRDDYNSVRFWNDSPVSYDEVERIKSLGVQVMTYDKLKRILSSDCRADRIPLNNIKVVVLDECHTIFVDKFIDGVDMVSFWLRTYTKASNMIFIGMTATPDVFKMKGADCGFYINELNKDRVISYKAKHMIITSENNLANTISERCRKGKTLVMLNSINQCEVLQVRIPHSATIYSATAARDKYDPEVMTPIRNHIVNHESLPDTFKCYDKSIGMYVDAPLRTLISTTTMREGFNIKPDCGVRNVVVGFSDIMNITQFLGRVRGDIDNLIVCGDAYEPSATDEYMASWRQAYDSFCEGKTREWSDAVSDLVYDNVKDWVLDVNVKAIGDFIPWMKKHFVDTNIEVYLQSDKDAILQAAIKSGFVGAYRCSFNKLRSQLRKNGVDSKSFRKSVNSSSGRIQVTAYTFFETDNEKDDTNQS